MAPSKAANPPYSKDERVLCFHHEMLYEAKILDCRQTEDNQSWQYRIHYKGWKNTYVDIEKVLENQNSASYPLNSG
jgi:mortality factor 4-like protein 1